MIIFPLHFSSPRTPRENRIVLAVPLIRPPASFRVLDLEELLRVRELAA